MNLERMLAMCHRDQWSVGDLDWRVRPRPMSESDERAIVQYFTNMAGIERLAGALFEEQRRAAETPILAEIFATFVRDELRHSHVAQMLADHYDVHKFRAYQCNAHLLHFQRHFVEAIRYLSPAVANAYITAGELLLDVALLRSLDDYVDDAMSHQAMALINRDESRHIAVDFYMVEYYCSAAYADRVRAQTRPSLGEELRAVRAFAGVLYHARPFFQEVFFEPLDLVDRTNRRLIEAFKRIQLLGTKEEVARMPFARFMNTLQAGYNHPLVGRLCGPLLVRLIGTDPRVIVQLYTEEEARRAQRMSFDALAEDALAAKYQS